jgi:hypothetical protein
MELNSDTLENMPQPDPSDWLKKLGETYSQVRFGPGVVGKTSRPMLALLGVWAIVLFRLSENVWLDSALLVGGVLATLIYQWWVSKTHAFAESHPDLALLEGAELVEYQRWEAAINGVPVPVGIAIGGDTLKQIGRQEPEGQ